MSNGLGCGLLVASALTFLPFGTTVVAAEPAAPMAGEITTVAGGGPADGASATTVSLSGPATSDSAGNVIVAYGNRVWRVSSGSVSTIAGTGSDTSAGDGGPALAASFGPISSVAVGPTGDVFVGEAGRLRRISGGTIVTIAGTGETGFGGDSGPAVAAQISTPSGLWASADGSVLIADAQNHRVRRVASGGTITTVAGNGTKAPNGFGFCEGGFSGDGGPALSAQLNEPVSIALDTAGSLLIADSCNFRVRSVSNTGIITTKAGNGQFGSSGDGGAATSAALWANPFSKPSVTADSSGRLLIGDGDARVRRVSPQGVISTVAGNGTIGYGGDGGLAAAALLDGADSISVDGSGNVVLNDQMNNRIRRFTPGGTIATIAGNGNVSQSGDGAAATASQLGTPQGVVYDGNGNLYIADTPNRRVRRVSTSGVITTFAGNGMLDTAGGSGDGGPATSASIGTPFGLAVNGAGDLYISSSSSGRVRKVTPAGTITTVAGSGTDCESGFSGDGGPATSSHLDNPSGLALDTGGNLYIADSGNQRVRKVTPGGTITTVAGTGTFGFLGDGGPATSAQLSLPTGLATDTLGNLYIADTGNGRIRKVTGGTISTIAGNGAPATKSVAGDGGPATSARLDRPMGVAVDGAGAVYVTQTSGPVDLPPSSCVAVPVTSSPVMLPLPVLEGVRRISPTGLISTVIGPSTQAFAGDGGPTLGASLNDPVGLTLSPAGQIVVADTGNHRIRSATPGAGPGAPTAVAASAGAQKATVHWSAPTNPGSAPVLGYWIASSPGGVRQLVPGSTTSVEVTSLTNGVPYVFTVTAINAWGESAPSSPSPPVTPSGLAPGAGFHGLVPKRILDSRTPNGGWSAKLVAGSPKDLVVTGLGGGSNVPSTASAVVMNVAVTGGSAGSFVTTYPAGTPTPNASNLNFGAGETIANLVTVKLGGAGKVSFANAVGSVDVIADVVGYYDDGTGPGDLYTGITPTRLLDSRTANGGWSSPLVAGAARTLTVRQPANAAGVPATATVVIANVTVTGSTAGSFVSVWPGGVAQPNVSNLNFGPGQTIPNLAIIGIGANGAISFANAVGSVDVIVDVVGYFDPTSGSRFHAVSPTRVLDDRVPTGLAGPWGPGVTRALPVAGTPGTNVPAGATGLVANVTATGATAGSFIAVFPDGVPVPNSSNVNFGSGQTIPNLVAVKVAANGKVSFYNKLGNVDIIADIVGYYLAT